VLDSLRFETISERYEGIVEAHKQIFDWIFQLMANNEDYNQLRQIYTNEVRITRTPKPAARNKIGTYQEVRILSVFSFSTYFALGQYSDKHVAPQRLPAAIVSNSTTNEVVLTDLWH
jgi:hypothetical protein